MRHIFSVGGMLLALLAVPLGLNAQRNQAVTQAPETVIDSDSLTMQGTDDYNEFTFAGRVHAEGRELLLLADKLVVKARRQQARRAPEGAVGQIGAIESIVATGNVEIRQAGRVAYAGRAEVQPDAGLVILSENPRIVDEKATVKGWKIVYNSQNKTVQVLPDPNQPQQGERQRSRVILSESAIPPLDYEHIQQPELPEPAEQAPQPAGPQR